MIVLSCSGLSLSYGTARILENLHLNINAGSKVGIIGGNGVGKTTLFKLITGEITPTSGNIYINPKMSIGMLSQTLDSIIAEQSVLETALSSFSTLIEIENQLNELSARMEAGDESVISRYTEMTDTFSIEGGYEYKSKTKSFLNKLGFDENSFDLPCSLLSGGQKTRLMLAVILLNEPDIILLDEPTNHLDIETTQWLEGVISASKKTFLIISHDRYFLDKVTDTTAEIEFGSIIEFTGNYTTFREKKSKMQEDNRKQYELQQSEIKRLEDFIENQRKWNRERNIIAAESRMKAIERMDKIKEPPPSERKIAIQFAASNVQSKDVLQIDELSKGFGETQLFSNLNLELFRSDRLFIIGKNGSGKTTLLKILTNQIASDSGSFRFGYSQSIGVFDQETQNLNENNSALDEIWVDKNKFSQTQLRSHLAGFGFYNDDVYKTVSKLSGGERARLSIAKLILCGASVLILDEPTNHLDISSKEVLENALSQFKGAIISVSHDRYFIKSLANKILELDYDSLPNGFCFFKGNYDEYLSHRQTILVSKTLYSDTKSTESDSKLQYLAEKEKQSQKRKHERLRKNLEADIARAENELELILVKETEFATDYEKLTELHEKETTLRTKIEEFYEKLIEIID